MEPRMKGYNFKGSLRLRTKPRSVRSFSRDRASFCDRDNGDGNTAWFKSDHGARVWIAILIKIGKLS